MSTSVFFFGGFNAAQEHIDAWLRSARQQKPNVVFTGFLWASGPKSWPADTVVKGSKKSGQFTSAVDTIKACTAEKIYIVGHSSGCAVANAVDKELTNTSNVALVTLDGFGPDPDQLKRSNTQVWGAECDGVKSKNYPGPSAGKRKIYQAKNCKKLYALHFVLVNAAANDDTVHSISTGYLKCEANLVWLP
jgi:hypothetical protein